MPAGKTAWTEEEDMILTFLYPEHTNAHISTVVGRSVGAVMARAFKLRLLKTAAFKHACGVEHGYRPGQQPANKGKPIEQWMKPESIARCASTRYKKGNTPHGTLFDGAIQIRNDKSGTPYLHIRLAKGAWELYQRYQYRKYIGELPADCIVAFKDGNTQNCHPFNLQLMTRAENMDRNSGVKHLPDSMVATYLSVRSKKPNPELKALMLQNPDLIELKRNQLLLQRTIKSHGTSTNQ